MGANGFRMNFMCCCLPCALGLWYMYAIQSLRDRTAHRCLACLWANICAPCAVFVASERNGISVKKEVDAWANLMKKVVTIDRN